MQMNPHRNEEDILDIFELLVDELNKDEKLRLMCIKLVLDYNLGHNIVSTASYLYDFIINQVQPRKDR